MYFNIYAAVLITEFNPGEFSGGAVGGVEFFPPYNYHKTYYTISDRTILCIISSKSQITAE